jgi:hypothetical protein
MQQSAYMHVRVAGLNLTACIPTYCQLIWTDFTPTKPILHFCNPTLRTELNDGSFFSLPVK